jgi:hypothetical protein
MDNSDDSKTFIKHVFKFDDDSKAEILNILQFAFIAIIPLVILNKSMQKYVPEADDKKSSVEISAEVVIQITVMLMGLLLIYRIVTFVPTYSGAKYPDYHVVYSILPLLLITLSLQTKLGEKVSILTERVMELWNGKPEPKKGASTKQQQQSSGQMSVTSVPAMGGYTDGTSISSLPTFDATHGNQNSVAPQQLPNYDNMYKQDNTPLVNAASPHMSEGMTPFEPMAANSVLGGGSFGSW